MWLELQVEYGFKFESQVELLIRRESVCPEWHPIENTSFAT